MAFSCLLLVWLPFLSPQDLILGLDGSSDVELYGRGLSAIEDFDGDGFADLLIGAPAFDGGAVEGGKVEIRSSHDGSLLLEWAGVVADAWLGYAVTSPGDIDGDGLADIITGAVFDSIGGPNSGGVYAFSSGTQQILWVSPGFPGGHCGFSLASVGDIDGDGIGDVLAGAPAGESQGMITGHAHVLSGATGQMIRSHFGSVSEMEFGHTVSALEDIDGDGVDDYAVGAHYDDTGHFRAGSVFLYSGASGHLIRIHRGNYSKAYYGNAIAGTSDLDGDGLGDILVGAPGGAYWGKAHVISGATGADIFVFESLEIGAEFGTKVSAADVNTDGVDDFVIAARFANEETGKVEVYSGDDGRLLSRLHGSDTGVRFGQILATVGDINGDGSEDWLVWSARESRLAHWAGRVELHSGSPLHTTSITGLQAGGTATAVIGGCAPGTQIILAWSLHGAGPVLSEWGSVSLSLPLVQMPAATANSQGEAHWTANIPSGAAGRTVWLQGLDLYAGALSQPLEAVIQ